MKKFLCFFFLLLAIMGGVYIGHILYEEHISPPEGISMVQAGDVPPEVLQDVKNGITGFQAFSQKYLHEDLERGVKLCVAATAEDYQSVLKEQFHQDAQEAKEISNISGGWTSGKAGVTAINGAAGVMDNSSDRMSTTAHELFHQWQFAASDGKDSAEKSIFWLEEGSADYVGALVAESMKGKSFRKWELDVLGSLRLAKKNVKPEALTHVNYEQRKKLMGKQYHSYEMADAMTICLLSKDKPEAAVQKIVVYYKELSHGVEGEQAFQKAFGMSYKDFLNQFYTWYQQKMKESASYHFSSRKGVDASTAHDLEQYTAPALKNASFCLGHSLRGEYDVILAKDPNDFAEAIHENCALPEKKAVELSKGSLWVENGSTILLETSQLRDKKQRAFVMAALSARLLEGQLEGENAKYLEWMDRGMAYVIGIRFLADQGFGSYDGYRRAWIQDLQGTDSRPRLKFLEERKGFSSASASFGEDITNEMAELAVDELVREHGWKSMERYLLGIHEDHEPSQTFTSVFGFTSENYSQRFEEGIMRLH